MEEEISDLEKIRLESLRLLNEFWNNEPDIKAENVDFTKTTRNNENVVLKNKSVASKRKKNDSTFIFRGRIPSERRSSSRLKNETPEYTYLDLDDDLADDEAKKSRRNSVFEKENYEYLIQTKSEVRPRNVVRKSVALITKPVEDITDEYIKNIATRSTIKVYSEKGTSCHQCRQKTIDSKTYCRDSGCHGVRGQFCGPCLLNRYGEDAAVALKDPKWRCPPCRNECNCSICRNRMGKAPTGILAPMAQSAGYKSVRHIPHSTIYDLYIQNKCEM